MDKKTGADSTPKDDDLCREDLHKHLDFIQAVVTRMSSASTSTKSWLLPVVTAAYGYGMTRNAWSVVALGLSAVLLFMFLDANYLRQEKAYRDLYDAVARKQGVPLFSLNPVDAVPGASREGDPPDIAPGEAYPEKESPQRVDKQGKLAARRDAWIPPKSVWASWSIAPFYGSLVVVGIVIGVRVCLF